MTLLMHQESLSKQVGQLLSAHRNIQGRDATHRRIGVLYLSYDGILEPLGQSQILPYLRGLSASGHRFFLVSFEKPNLLEAAGCTLEVLRRELAKDGINWRILHYHKRPTVPATLFDVCQGTLVGLKLILAHRLEVIHARSYVAALMAWLLSRLTRAKFVFDMRGFWADERVEGGIWPRGIIYNIAKCLERVFIHGADFIVSLTETGKTLLQETYKSRSGCLRIAVIPTCVDVERFKPRQPDRGIGCQAQLAGKTVLAYVGSVGTWYAMDEVLSFFRVVSQEIEEARLLLIVHGTVEPLVVAARQLGIENRIHILHSMPNAEVPRWLSLARVGIAFYGSGFSNVARFPTKVGEYLASGLAVVVSGRVGDCDRFVEQARVGVCVREFSAAEYLRGAQQLRQLLQDEELMLRCRQVAMEQLSVAEGVKRYDLVYQQLVRSESATAKGSG